MTLQATFPLRVVAYPAPDLEGVMITHALDLDIMAQGSTLEESWATLHESIVEMIAFRLSQKLPAVEWTPAPEEVWQSAEAVVGQKLNRTPPAVVRFEVGASSEESPQPEVIIADRAPAMAHAC